MLNTVRSPMKSAAPNARLSSPGFAQDDSSTAFAQCFSGSAASSRFPRANSRIRFLLIILTPRCSHYGNREIKKCGAPPILAPLADAYLDRDELARARQRLDPRSGRHSWLRGI